MKVNERRRLSMRYLSQGLQQQSGYTEVESMDLILNYALAELEDTVEFINKVIQHEHLNKKAITDKIKQDMSY